MATTRSRPGRLNSANTSDFSRLNQAKLEEYKNQLAAQERLLREQQALFLGQQPTSKTDDHPPPGPPQPRIQHSYPDPQEALKTQLQLEQQKKDYESLFANNLALSYRQELKQTSETEGFQGVPENDGKECGWEGYGNLRRQFRSSFTSAQAQRAESSLSSSMAYLKNLRPYSSANPSVKGPKNRPANGTARNRALPAKVDDYNHSTGKQFRVLAGTVLETVLLNRINSDFSGPVNCMVTSPVYSHDRQRVLIPEGSKVLGEAQKLATLGQKRVAVAFHRLIMPDGFSVNLDQFKGLNQIGETALRDKVNNHYLRIFGMSVALGLISGFSNRGVTYYGPGTSGTDAYRAGVADSLSQSSQRILDRYINILPTVTILEGHRVKVYLTNDLFLPDFITIQMPDDLAVEQASISKEEK